MTTTHIPTFRFKVLLPEPHDGEDLVAVPLVVAYAALPSLHQAVGSVDPWVADHPGGDLVVFDG